MEEYPKWKYHATKEALIVPDAAAEKALGEGWQDRPVPPGSPPKPEPSPPEEPKPPDPLEPRIVWWRGYKQHTTPSEQRNKKKEP